MSNHETPMTWPGCGADLVRNNQNNSSALGSQLKVEETPRGFALINFVDRYGVACSLQKSSLATEDAIWLGVNDANPIIMASKAGAYGVNPGDGTGWVPFPVPEDVSMTTRMHLTQDLVRDLLPVLQNFVETGEVAATRPPADRVQGWLTEADIYELANEHSSGTTSGGALLIKPMALQAFARAILSRQSMRGSDDSAMSAALNKIIEMNRQHAEDQYGDANKAESWACIRVAREALAAAPQAQPASPADEHQSFIDSLDGEDKMFEQIDRWARESFTRHRFSIRGQQITAADNERAHVIWATLRWAKENPSPQEGNAVDECTNCHKCLKGKTTPEGLLITSTRMILCPSCGNKRCPKASDHTLACTNSNEPGQVGSVYGTPTPANAAAANGDGLPLDVMRALREARDVAMLNVVEARIPECGDFAAIAQNLDWALGELEGKAPAAGQKGGQHG